MSIANLNSEAVAQRFRDVYGEGKRGIQSLANGDRIIHLYLRGKRVPKPQTAWRIGEALNFFVPWSTGLLALAAAGHDAQLMGVIGWLIALGVTPADEDIWRLISTAPFRKQLATFDPEFAYNVLDAETFPCGSLEKLNKLEEIILAVERKHFFKEKRMDKSGLEKNDHKAVLPAKFAAFVKSIQYGHLSEIEVCDPRLEAAWSQWNMKNDRSTMPVRFSEAIRVLSGTGVHKRKMVKFAWSHITEFFDGVERCGFENAKHLFKTE